MYKRPTIRKPVEPRGVVESLPRATELEYALEMRKRLTPNTRRRIREGIMREAKRRRQATQFKRRYTLSGLTETLFNAVGDTYKDIDIKKLFDRILREKPKSILKASMKGGRFEEFASYTPKQVTELKQGTPNQLGIAFDIDGKTCYANIFSSGTIRYTGATESKTRHFVEEFIGLKMEDYTISNVTGQLYVDKYLDLPRLAGTVRTGPYMKVLFDPEARDFHVTLQVTQEFERQINKVPERRHASSTVRVSLHPEQEKMTERIKMFSLAFYPNGAIQYQGKFSREFLGLLIAEIKEILDQAQRDGVFKGDYTEAREQPKHKSTSAFPPDPPDSFEGKCPPGYYCRPNAKGFPTCYKIPVINESSRRTMVEAYMSVGVAIPQSVKKLFSIDIDTTKKKEKVVHEVSEIPDFILDGHPYYVIGDKIKGTRRSNGRENPPRACGTTPVELLHRYARALDLDPSGLSREEICKAIHVRAMERRRVGVSQNATNFIRRMKLEPRVRASALHYARTHNRPDDIERFVQSIS